MGTETRREFYSYHRGQLLTETENETFDVAAWMSKILPELHYRTHAGQTFSSHHNSSNLAEGLVLSVKLTTGAISPHMIFNISGKLDYDFEILEAPSSTGGTAHVAYNRNRPSATTSTGTLVLDPSISADGTVISSNAMGEGQKFGGQISVDNEWILSASTDYIFRLTSRANNNRVHINLTWYEPQ